MNVLDLIVYVFNSITGASFELMSLSDLSAQAAAFTYWSQIFDVPFIISFVIWLSVFYFVWKFTYQLIFRLLMHVCQFPKKRKSK